MKVIGTLLLLLAAAIGFGWFLTRDTSAGNTSGLVSTPTEPGFSEPNTQAYPAATATRKREAQPAPITPARAAEPPPVSPVVSANTPGVLAANQAIETLVSPDASYQAKQSAWGQLRSAGKLDQAIVELEQRAAQDPRSAELPATLGQGYLQKAGTIQDVSEQGILGLKADQSFALSLKLDPNNWEARFWKATAMSYWPPQLGKGKEVIESLVELVQQQEVLPPQPQYAQVYVLLGEQYQKQGNSEYAAEAWTRGLALFPEDKTLKGKLNSASARQEAP